MFYATIKSTGHKHLISDEVTMKRIRKEIEGGSEEYEVEEVSEAETGAETTQKPISRMNVEELKAHATSIGAEFAEDASKGQLKKLIQEKEDADAEEAEKARTENDGDSVDDDASGGTEA